MPVTRHRVSTPRLGVATVLTLVLVALPALVGAQQSQAQVYMPNELSVHPKLAAPGEVARLVRSSYPDALRRAGVNGTVQVEFVVGVDGKVEGTSIEIIAASPPALGPAAKSAVEKFTFKPGQVNGKAVRTRVAIPLVYRAS